ncbi:uncharacterized protein PAC_16142 [Phialocephala subalpina]|uniref:Uncharacterized protein n=1 Tax=Phialocephala subalpina TaxID=576137 RepID=A0A1L7XMF6_9HELO|nr:uncharacterized protein PAC_16142 [Phialocephala subalpina]
MSGAHPISLMAPHLRYTTAAAVAVNSVDKDNIVPESAKCYLESLDCRPFKRDPHRLSSEYTCGHRLDLTPVTHMNCKGIPSGQSQCSNTATQREVLPVKRKCRKCAAMMASENVEVAKVVAMSKISVPAPATPPNNKSKRTQCGIMVPPRPFRIIKKCTAGTDEDWEDVAGEDEWEKVSKKDLESMDGKDDEWVNV